MMMMMMMMMWRRWINGNDNNKHKYLTEKDENARESIPLSRFHYRAHVLCMFIYSYR
jgi:hypothetical protein